MQAADLSVGAVGGGGTPSHATTIPTSGTAMWRAFAQIPDLVNGDASGFGFIFVSAGLAGPYHWVPSGFLAGLPAVTGDASLRMRVGCEAAVYASRLIAAGTGADKARLIAVLLASARIAIRRAWVVSDADIIAAQRFVPTPTAPGPAAVTLNAAGELSAACDGLGAPIDFETERDECLSVYDAHADTMLHKAALSAIGMPACNGCVIVATMVHHYVEPHKAICDAVIDQHFGADYAPPAGLTMDDVKDVICHKASHPIKSEILVGLARSESVKVRLNAIGHGSATVRLPARFQPEKAAAAMHALVSKASQAGSASNVVANIEATEKLVAAVSAVLEKDKTNAGLLAATKEVDDFKTRYGLDVAWLAGFMASMFDETRANKRSRSILDSYAVKGLIEEEQPSYAEGYSHYLDAAKWRRTRAKEGHLAGYGKMGADAPKAFVNPESSN